MILRTDQEVNPGAKAALQHLKSQISYVTTEIWI